MNRLVKMEDLSLWQKAVSYAAYCHLGQTRKDKRTPYIAHPFRVTLVVRHLFEVTDTVALCVALLHDVIEDTLADFDKLQEIFGSEIATAVACLTKDKRLPEAKREPAFYEQIARGSWQARLVKLADAYDNVCDNETPKSRKKALTKARWAIKAAGNDPRLKRAINILTELIKTHEKRKEQKTS